MIKKVLHDDEIVLHIHDSEEDDDELSKEDYLNNILQDENSNL
jgi:hypothetical protein